ncbi:hypothetical protein L0F63_004831, partial [Massospora cicadina]
MPPSAEELKSTALDSKLLEIQRRAHPEQMIDEKPTRDDWMMVPPEPRILGFPLSPPPDKPKVADQSLWTETPEQRRQRHLNGDGAVEKAPTPKRPLIEQHDSGAWEGRPASLLELHQSKIKERSSKKNKLADDHPANRRFDWEKDMSIKSLNPKTQIELLKKAGSLSERFSR